MLLLFHRGIVAFEGLVGNTCRTPGSVVVLNASVVRHWVCIWAFDIE